MQYSSKLVTMSLVTGKDIEPRKLFENTEELIMSDVRATRNVVQN